MESSRERELISDFPAVFTKLEAPSKEEYPKPISLYGIECGMGWEPLIRGFLRSVEKMGIDIDITQVKSKNGGLRIYWETESDKEQRKFMVMGMTNLVEQLSYNFCEICGRPGECYRLENRKVTFVTRCTDCFESEEFQEK